ncbi:MAG: competence/damage-inducible protein A [Sphingobacteriales bacterium]|nr:competence/damage-inducible protein A [Sphingobacteriales bacterium]
MNTNVSIITIGDELLIGQVIDTNSAWMAQELNKWGIRVIRRVAVGDNWNEIWNALDEESKKAGIILITGGLGPTADDITKPLLCEYFGGKMVMNAEALENVTCLFETVFKRPLTERNIKQAEVPNNCTLIPNKRGTAPGMWFEKNGCIYVSLPGVPHEMKGMMENTVIPMVAERFQFPKIEHRTLVCYGIGEAMLADLTADFESGLPPEIKLAYLPHDGMVRLRLSSYDVKNHNNLERTFQSLAKIVGTYLIATADQTMEEILASLLISKSQTVATAESCTGGYIAHLLSKNPGSSAYYAGSMVTYSYEAKEQLLGVNQSTLIEYGAVSEQVVKEMASGLLNRMKSDYAIAVSGILGPDGGLPDKPVGTVWMAAGDTKEIITKKIHLRFNREKNTQVAAMHAMNLLRAYILKH